MAAIPSWGSVTVPAAPKPRRRAIELLQVLLIIVALVAAAVAFAEPWRPDARPGGDALARYLPSGAGAAATFVGDDGTVDSDSVDVIASSDTVSALPSAVLGAATEQLEADGLLDDEPDLDDLVAAMRQTEVTVERLVSRQPGEAAIHSRVTLMRTPTGLYELAEDGPFVTLGFSPPALIFPADLGPDREPWSSEGAIDLGGTYTYEAEVVDEIDDVATPAGRVDDCLVVQATATFTFGSTERVVPQEVTLCPGVGAVARVSSGVASTSEVTTSEPGIGSVEPGPFDPAAPADLGDPAGWALERFATTTRGGVLNQATIAPFEVPSDPSIVLVADEIGDLVALDGVTGEERWRIATDGPVYGRPAFDPDTGVIVFGASDGIVRAIDVDGVLLWSLDIEENLAGGGVVAGGLVVLAGEDRVVRGLDPTDGREVWRHEAAAPLAASPAVIDDLVVVVDDGGTVTALEADDGEVAWSATAGGPADAPVAAGEGLVVVGDRSTGLTALDAGTGETVWDVDSNGTDGGAAVSDGAVAFVEFGGDLVFVAAGDGEELERHRGPYVGTPIAAADGTFVAVQDDGDVDVLDSDGEVVETFDADDAVGPLDGDPGPEVGPALGPSGVWMVDTDSIVRRLGPPRTAPARVGSLWGLSASDPRSPLEPSLYQSAAAELDGKAVVVGQFGELAVIDPRTGDTDVPGTAAIDILLTGPLVVGDTIVLGTASGLVGIDPVDASTRWEAAGLVSPAAAPVAAGDLVLWLDLEGDGTIRAIDARDGTERWSAPSSNAGAGPAVAGSVVAAGSPLVGRDVETGEERWQLDPAVTPVGQPAGVGGLVVVPHLGTNSAGQVVGVDAGTGEVVWEGTLPPGASRELFAPVVPVGDAVVVRTNRFVDGFGFVNGPLAVFDAATGELRWERPVEQRRLGEVGDVGGRVAVMSLDGTVTTFDAEDGTPVAAWADLPIAGDAIIDPRIQPVVIDGVVVVTLGNAVGGIDAEALAGGS